MVSFFMERSTVDRQIAARETALRRAQDIASSFTPAQAEAIVARANRNPTLPADVLLALGPTANDDIADQIEAQLGRMNSPGAIATASVSGRGGAGASAGTSAGGGFLDTVGDAIGDAKGAAYTAFKGVSRTAMPVLDIGPQMLKGSLRNAYRQGERLAAGDLAGAAESWRQSTASAPAGLTFLAPLEQTDLGQGLYTGAADVAAGRNPMSQFEDWGDGFFINEQAKTIQQRKQAEINSKAFLPNGELFSLGRGAASLAGFEKDGTGYKILSGTIDAAIELGTPSLDKGFDPLIAKGIAGAARRVGAVDIGAFTRSVGGFSGVIDEVDPQAAARFLDSRAGSNVVNWLAETTDVEAIWRRTGGKYDPELITRLADVSTPQDVRMTLLNGLESRGAIPVMSTRLGAARRQAMKGVRWTGEVPDRMIDLTDPLQSVQFVDDFAQHVRIDGAIRNQWIDKMARAGDKGARRSVYNNILSETAVALNTRGIGLNTPKGVTFDSASGNWLDAAGDVVDGKLIQGRARQLTSYANSLEETFRIELDEMISNGMDWNSVRVSLGGRTFDDMLPSAMLLAERADALPVPNLQELRRATSMFDVMFETLEDQGTIKHIANVMGRPVGSVANVLFDVVGSFNRIWKDTRLLRGAYAIRVVGEEQIRMAAAGYNSMFRHPFSYIAELMQRADTKDLRGALLADSDAYLAARSGGSSLNGLRDTVSRGTEKYVRIQKGASDPAEFLEAWADELMTLRKDPIANKVAQASSADEVIDWLMNPQSRLRAPDGAEIVADGNDVFTQLKNMHPDKPWDETYLRGYINSLSRRLEDTTSGNPELMDLIRGDIAEDALDLDAFIDFAPTHAITSQLIPNEGAGGLQAAGAMYDKATERMFEMLASKPTNTFSRSPVFRQEYAKALRELAPLSNSANLDRAIEGANLKRLISKGDLEHIRSVAGNGQLSIGQIDELAKRAALNKVQDLLYDLSKKSQFFDINKLLFPFGEAWKEVVVTWTKLATQQPAFLARRAGAVAEAGRDSGAFYKDENDEMVFKYPGTTWLTEQITDHMGVLPGVSDSPGVPVQMTGRLSGLNMVGEVMPGLGPVGQYPASKMLPQDPSGDKWRNLLMPYGDPGEPFDIKTNFMPTWLATVVKGQHQMTQDEIRLFANTKHRVAQYLMTTGDYDMNTPGGQADLLDDAEAAASRLYLVRGMVQFGAPSSPQMKPQMLGPDGELVDYYVMYDRYQKLVETDPENALEKFLAEFGTDALLIPQGNTTATVAGGVPLNGKAALDWVRENPELADEHPQVYGFFAPSDGSTDFNYDAYRRALESGEIVQLTPEQKLRLANHKVAQNIYNGYRQQMTEALAMLGRASPTDEQSRMLNKIKNDLEKNYTGFGQVDDIAGRTPPADLIDQGHIDRALADPLLADTEAGRALAEYWALRDQAVEAAEVLEFGSTGESWRTVEDAAFIRQGLRTKGDELAAEYPAFATLWNDFLIREFKDLADEKAPEQAAPQETGAFSFDG